MRHKLGEAIVKKFIGDFISDLKDENNAQEKEDIDGDESQMNCQKSSDYAFYHPSTNYTKSYSEEGQGSAPKNVGLIMRLNKYCNHENKCN